MTVVDVGEGEVVVLGHSYLWDAEMWRPQIEALSRSYRVIVPNLWGHGTSDDLPPGTGDMRDLGRHHLMLLDSLGIDRFALAGLSIGGMWGMEIACLAPERVTALALLDTSAGPEPELSREQYLGMFRIVEAAGRIPDEMIEAIVPLYFAPATLTAAPALPAILRAGLKTVSTRRLLDTIVPLGHILFGRRDLRPDLAHLRMPSLVMTGSEDIPRPVREGREIAEILRCQFIELPGAGHISALEVPDLVSTHLADFLHKALG
ncbi:MAG TPA: alpha/beta fold hydrolase [Dongiaceae bacterium]|nr:alpha/beta fold hydrolase [Dongiaceae bacterium]